MRSLHNLSFAVLAAVATVLAISPETQAQSSLLKALSAIRAKRGRFASNSSPSMLEASPHYLLNRSPWLPVSATSATPMLRSW